MLVMWCVLWGSVMVLLGVVFLAVGTVVNRKYNETKSWCTEQTTAVITEFKRYAGVRAGDDTRTYYWCATYEYTVNGTEYCRVSHVGVPKNTFTVGQEVVLYYNPQKPEEYFVEEEQVSRFVTIFKTVGMVLLVTGIIVPVIILLVMNVM